MTASPTGVPSRLRSLRIGISVPRAVVVKTMIAAAPFMSWALKYGTSVTIAAASAIVASHVASPTLP